MTSEWDRGDDTVPDAPVTQPHAVLELPGYDVGRKDGCKACCEACQEEVIAALASVCRAKGLSNSEIDHIILAVRQRIAPT